MKRILFLTTAHHYNDDRILYHQAMTLSQEGFHVKITSLTSDYKGMFGAIEIEAFKALEKSRTEKSRLLQTVAVAFVPDCIICSEPLAVQAAHTYAKNKKVSIIYDITEWYPSRRMLAPYAAPTKFLHAVKFMLIQLYAGLAATHFIFGEHSKKFPLAYLFPRTPRLSLPYYPDSKYISRNIKQLDGDAVCLCYTGRTSKTDGVENFFRAAEALRRRNPQLRVKLLLIIGRPKQPSDAAYLSELVTNYGADDVKLTGPVPLENFTAALADADICFDLRDKNFESTHCLPIKLFYYAAAGKPVIYTDLKATRQHVDVAKFGYLVNPCDEEQIALHIESYLQNHSLYDAHAHNAAKQYDDHYNWEVLRADFLSFIKKSLH